MSMIGRRVMVRLFHSSSTDTFSAIAELLLRSRKLRTALYKFLEMSRQNIVSEIRLQRRLEPGNMMIIAIFRIVK